MAEARATSGATLEPAATACSHCGFWHQGACLRIKAIEYHSNGTVKRVEYHEPQPIIVGQPDPTLLPAPSEMQATKVLRPSDR